MASDPPITAEGAGSATPDPHPSLEDMTITCSVVSMLNLITATLWSRAEKARRAPEASITVYLPESFSAYFDRPDGFWRKCVRPRQRHEKKDVIGSWWSPFFEALEGVARFGDLVDYLTPQVHAQSSSSAQESSMDIPVPYKLVGGPCRLNSSGDLVVVLPPARVDMVRVSFGPARKLHRVQVKLWFSVGVVSATRDARLKLHHDYPEVKDSTKWLQVPPFDPRDHFERHIKRVCAEHHLRPSALAVKAALAWDTRLPEVTFLMVHSRPADARGAMLWQERTQRYVTVKNKRHRETIVCSNTEFREHSRRASIAKRRRAALRLGPEQCPEAAAELAYDQRIAGEIAHIKRRDHRRTVQEGFRAHVLQQIQRDRQAELTPGSSTEDSGERDSDVDYADSEVESLASLTESDYEFMRKQGAPWALRRGAAGP